MKVPHVFHEWLPYSEPFQASDHSEIAQIRRCSVCGKAQIKSVRRPWNWWFDVAQLSKLWKLPS